ncbi:MAG: AarF/UbiB family protein [Anaerolineales bacterium]|jgi:predicted unusual protein kinase regulating ubiquinone biosynthesis (AarF/ABC1/UbiB family)
MLRSRYNRITKFFARVLISFIIWELVLPPLGFKGKAQQTRSRRLRNSAAQFRSLAVEMGGLLIKLGQFFSAREDVLPEEITSELADLQDEVPPEKFEDIRQIVEAEFGVPLQKKFSSFEEIPLAAASLGQVHRANLRVEDLIQGGNNGNAAVFGEKQGQYPHDQTAEMLSVVVKIQRPDIHRIIETDLAAMRTVGKWLHRYRPIRRRMHLPSLLDEFTRISLEEIDYLAEGHNAERFSENFKDEPNVCIPRVFWTHTTRRVLTLEDVLAIKISDYAAIKAAGIEPGDVARRLINIYLKQFFEDGFFHADPHPGNLFVYPIPTNYQTDKGQTRWQLTFVDFGMVGRVSPDQRAGFREAAIGVATRDPERLTRAYQMLGILLPEADLSLLKQAEVEIFNRFWGKDMGELRDISHQEMREFAYEFRELLYKLPFQIPQDLILLGRAVGILSGICTGLDPKFNVWQTITPYAQRLLKEETFQGGQLWLDAFRGMLQDLIYLPRRVNNLLDKIERGDLIVQEIKHSRQLDRIERALYLGAAALIFGALLLGGIQLYLGGEKWFALALLSLAALIFGSSFLLVIRKRK